jgi:hypothetical protein
MARASVAWLEKPMPVFPLASRAMTISKCLVSPSSVLPHTTCWMRRQSGLGNLSPLPHYGAAFGKAPEAGVAVAFREFGRRETARE